MTWLALAWWQAWTLAAATATAVVWLFFLRLRHPRRPVPSLLLWRRALEQEHPQSLVERLRRLISLLIALVVALLVALAPGRPMFGSAGSSSRSLLIVVDTSPTMSARMADGRTRLDQAKRRVRAVIAARGPGARMRIADTAGRASTSPEQPLSETLRTLDTVAVRPGADRLPRVGADEQLLVLTDGVRRREWPSQATVMSVFEAAPNVAIATFQVRSTTGRPFAYEALVEVVNDATPQQVALSISDTAGQRAQRTFALARGERARETISLQGFARGAVRATVSAPDNRFELDDTAVDYLPVTAPVRTVLVTEGNAPLETALGLDPLVDLATVRPAQYDGSGEADIVVLDGAVRDRAPASPALIIHPPKTAWLDASISVGDEITNPGIRAWEARHPVLQSVSPADLRIDRASRLELAKGSAGGEAIASAEESALIVVQDRPARRVVLAFDLRASDLPFQVGFPVFMRNVVAWLAGLHAPLRATVGTVAVPWPDAEVTLADGAAVPSRRVLDSTVFDAPAPAVFLAGRGGDRVPLVVNADAANLARVNASAFDGPSPEEWSDPPSGTREWWPRMLAIAFALAAVEWFTYHRRVTV